MPHLKPRDILEFLLFAISFVAIFAIAGFLETAPMAIAMWTAAGLALFLWIIYIVVVARQRTREVKRATFWRSDGDQWIALDGSGRTRPITQKTPTSQPIFDQDDYKDH